MADDLNQPQSAPAAPVVAPKSVVAPVQPIVKKTVIWDGTWSGIKANQRELPAQGIVMAKQAKNSLGNFYLDAKSGKPAFFPNPETYPKGGYFAGEAVPVG